jgi:hypothetical protein
MIDREQSRSTGDPGKEAAALSRRLHEIKGRRARYQEMAAAELIDLDELRGQLARLEEVRRDTERALDAVRRRVQDLESLELNRSTLLGMYAGIVPDALETLPPAERHRVYGMLHLEAKLAPSGDLEMSGDVMLISKCGTPYPRD